MKVKLEDGQRLYPPKYPLKELVEEVGREVGLRRNVYPGFVKRHKMDAMEAEVRIDRMERVHLVLKWLAANEALVREVDARMKAAANDPAPKD